MLYKARLTSGEPRCVLVHQRSVRAIDHYRLPGGPPSGRGPWAAGCQCTTGAAPLLSPGHLSASGALGARCDSPSAEAAARRSLEAPEAPPGGVGAANASPSGPCAAPQDARRAAVRSPRTSLAPPASLDLMEADRCVALTLSTSSPSAAWLELSPSSSAMGTAGRTSP